jgi:hypothetical protein
MPKPAKFKDSDQDKLREDTAETAFRVLQEAIGEQPKTKPGHPPRGKNPEAVKRGRKGGKKGGPARKRALGALRRHASAKKAARARWTRK